MMLARTAPMVALTALALLTLAARAEAQERKEGESPSVSANTGLITGVGPLLLLPSDGGPLGGGLEADVRYGIKAGPVIVGPGGRISGYAVSGRFVGIVMPAARVTLPVGPFAPYAVGGLGGGFLTNPGEGGVSFLAGLGTMVHFGRMIAVGLEASFRTITGTEFQMFTLGPVVSLGL
jgi:hypothetical protein